MCIVKRSQNLIKVKLTDLLCPCLLSNAVAFHYNYI